MWIIAKFIDGKYVYFDGHDPQNHIGYAKQYTTESEANHVLKTCDRSFKDFSVYDVDSMPIRTLIESLADM